MSTAVVTDPQLQTEALTTVKRATTIQVVSNETRVDAAELGRICAGLQKQAVDWFAPMKRAAAATHKAICEKENEVVKPLEDAKRYLSTQIGTYDQQQEKLRREEEARQQRIAREAAEAEAHRLAQEIALADAVALEAQGDRAGADAVLNNPVPQPVYVPPVVIPRETPKLQGVAGTEKWAFRITNPDLIPNMYKTINEKQIGQVVRANKNKTDIPGIEVYPVGGASFRA